MKDRHTVLVVEDDTFIRQDTSDHLRECGFMVFEAEDVEKAIMILLAHPEIDLVFTDVRMPGPMDGLDLARWIMENRPATPVMIATGDLGRVTAMDELCAAETFIKPYDQDKVVDRIRRALAKATGGAGTSP